MRALAWFLGTLLAAGLIGALLAYPAYELASRIAPFAFHRVASRVAMLILLALLVWLFRHLGLTTKRDLGYGLPWGRFLKVSALWGVIGVATASAGACFLLATGLRVVPDPEALLSAPSLARLLAIGLSSGIAVALLEETVLRGAMHTAIARESGQWCAVATTAPLYAILHFFANAHIPPDQLSWASGFDLLARSAAPWSHPAVVFDAFLAWLAVGLVLSLTRVLSGNIAAAVGLHAGWVAVLRLLSEGTAPGAGAASSAWVGRLDGLLGYWILPWAAAIALVLWLTRSRWAPYAAGVGVLSGAIDASLSRRSTGSSISR
ncbi:MAG TPA: CPBP family glutamic-type intramembrane protease [Steroidobacteraceae bacterium]|nr:CPBP family glutamic-type intramembrane protease [Steroidobacteraceae bacterium]